MFLEREMVVMVVEWIIVKKMVVVWQGGWN